MNKYTFKLFGLPKLLKNNNNITFPEKGFQLVALLSRSKHNRLSRKICASFLWDEVTSARAFANLRQLLLRVRKSCPVLETALHTDANEIWLDVDKIEIDVCSFLIKEPDEAIDCYVGDFFAGTTNYSNSFGQWLRVEQETLRERYYTLSGNVLLELTRYGIADRQKILDYGQRMIALAPEREATYRIVVEAFGRAGYYEDALRTVNDLRAMLAREFSCEPDATTQNIINKIVRQQPRAAEARVNTGLPAALSAPRIAFLEPRWREADQERIGLLKALVEDVSNELSRYRTFIILAPHSTFQFDKNKDQSPEQNFPGPDFTISGFLKPNNALSLRMTSTKSEEIFWAGEFRVDNEQLTNSFNQLTQRVAASLAVGIEREIAINTEPAAKKGAYYQYLLGQDTMRDCKLASLRKARKFYQASASDDNGFAAAHARIAQTLYQEWLMLSADDPYLLNSAYQHAVKAVELDPNSGLANWISGVILLYRREFDECERFFRSAEVLSPNSADMMVQYGDALSHLGMPDEGMQKFRYSLELNPLPPEHYWWVGASIAFKQNEFGEAINYCEKIQNEESVLRILASANALNGDIEKARHYGNRLKEAYPDIKADDLVNLPPDKGNETIELFIEGLRLAGIK